MWKSQSESPRNSFTHEVRTNKALDLLPHGVTLLLPLSGISVKFPSVPGADEGHAVSPEVRAEVRRPLEVLAAHLAGQGAALLGLVLGRGRRRGRAPRRALALVVPAAGSVRGGAARRLAVRRCVPHFVGDETVARQRGGGSEAGAALQALQGAALRPARLMLADVLQELRLVLRCEAARGATEARVWLGGGGAGGSSGNEGRLLRWARAVGAVLGRLLLHGRSLFAASPDAGVLLR